MSWKSWSTQQSERLIFKSRQTFYNHGDKQTKKSMTANTIPEIYKTSKGGGGTTFREKK